MKIKKVLFNYPKCYNNIDYLIQSNGGVLRLIGGCVRDFLLFNKISDFDLATNLPPNKIIQIFSSSVFQVVTLNLEHGTILLVYKTYSFEITTIREDMQCFGRYALVKFTNSWQQDALRRDFTINALSINLLCHLYDYTEGLFDIKIKRIKFIGNPKARIFEDKLRILRYFRFLSFFGNKNLHFKSLSACIRYFSLLKDISSERKKNELFKLLAGYYVFQVVQIFIRNNLFQYIGFMTSINKNFILSNLFFFFGDSIINISILLLLFFFFEKKISLIKTIFKLSNQEYKILQIFTNFQAIIHNDYQHYQYIHVVGIEIYKKFLFVRNNFFNIICYKNLAKEHLYNNFPIDGRKLQNSHIYGVKIGVVFNLLKKYWYNNKNMLTQQELMQLVKI